MSVITYLNQAEYDVFVQKADAATTGTYWQLYTWLADTLQSKGFGFDNPTVLWLRGATEANAGRGAMSELIRTYSSTEYDLRYGGSVGATLMQQASDAVAKNLINDIKGLSLGSIKFGIPDITRIAQADATAVGKTLFGESLGHDKTDTAFANNSGWSGALLFTQLQSDQTWRLMSPVTPADTHDTQINTLNDWRDVLFAYMSYSAGLKAAAKTYAKNLLINPNQRFRDESILISTFSSYIANYIIGGGNGDLEAAVVGGTDNPVLQSAFELIADVGANVFVDMLMGAALGRSVIGSTNDANFAANARTFFSGLTPSQLQSISARPLSDTLYANATAAQTDVRIRAALAGLSVVALDVSPAVENALSLYDPSTGEGVITTQWLSDRDEMLHWVKLYGASGAAFNQRFSVFSELGETAVLDGDYIYKDMASGLTLDIDGFNPTTLQSKMIVFGSGSSDVLQGGGLDDHLYGGAGNDMIESSEGNDYVEGGAGLDTYKFSRAFGADTIMDSDHFGSVMLDGVTLSRGTLDSATHAVSADGLVSYTIMATSNLMITRKGSSANSILVENWANGDLGIYLSAAVTLNNPDANNQLGTAGSDILEGNRFKNSISGAGGNDLLTGNGGDDVLNGGLGNDVLYGDGDTAPTADEIKKQTYVADVAGNDTLDGGKGNDCLYGEDGADLLLGGEGIDTLDGGKGNDKLYADAGEDFLKGREGNDRLYGGMDDDDLDGGEGNDALFAEDGNDILDGRNGNDTLNAGSGNDILTGGLGADQMSGGEGVDVYYVDDLGDMAVDVASVDIDTVYSSVSFVLGTGLDYLELTESANLTGYGNTLNNVIIGNSGHNTLFGEAGNDTITANGGNDTIDGGSGDDVIDASSGNNKIDAGSGLNTINTSSGNDTITAMEENDTINAGDGNNLIDSGLGKDSITVYGGSSQIFLGAGDDYIIRTGKGTLTERALIHAGTGNDQIFCYSGRDAIFSEDGNDLIYVDGYDTIDSGAGDDDIWITGGGNLIRGGLGADSIYIGWDEDFPVLYAADIVYGGDGSDEISSGRGDDKVYGQAGNDNLNGGLGNDQLEGGDGADRLKGNEGSDTLIGGGGNDYYDVDSLSDVVVEMLGEGIDLVQSDVDVNALYAGVENLISVAGRVANGNELNNEITGNFKNNYIDGGLGIDTLIGDWGDDIYVVDNVADVVTENLNEGTDTIQSSVSINALVAHVENFTLTGTTLINGTGNELANLVTGNIANNKLMGGLGNDTLSGGGVADVDTLIGGAGNDTYLINSTLDVITESLNEGVDTLSSSVTTSLMSNIEQLVLTGTAAINGTGNELGNYMVGNAANNVLNGGLGIDTIRGGLGNDTLEGGDGGDWVDYRDMTAAVTVNLSNTSTAQNTGAAGLDLLTNFENIFGGSGNDTLIGSLSANIIRAGLGNDSLDGGAGIDYVDYRDFSTALTVKLGLTTAQNTGAAGMDTLINFENLLGGAGNDTLSGNALVNRIEGNAGNDVLSGAAGNDALFGGAGNDTYRFARTEGQDVITDTDATAGNKDVLAFQTGITNDQLWFKHAGNDLVVSVIGTTDQVTIKDWYVSGVSTLNTASVVESISAGGKVLSHTKVEALVGAMAAFTAPVAGQTTLPSTYQSSLNAVIAANWQ